MTRSALYLLGSPRIERDGASLEMDTRKALALVAHLAVTRQPQTRDALAGLLWPEYGQARARAALRRTLSALQRARADGWLVADRETVGLAGGDELWVDLDEFHRRLAECRTHGHPEAEVCPRCLGPLGEAAALYRGDFMDGFGLRDSVEFDDWQLYQSEGLRGELAGALDRLARGHGALWEWDTAIAHARRRLALDHLHEPAHAALMRLYALAGQRAAALRQYRECVRLLQSELGVPPLEETTTLYRAIKEEDAPPLPDEGSGRPPREDAAASRPAPPPDSPLVGRAGEWEALLRAYDAARERGHVAVLEGEAGIGKTRLAEEFLDHARSRGAGIVAARCYADQANLAYGPFFEGLSAVVDRPPGAGRSKGYTRATSPRPPACCPGSPRGNPPPRRSTRREPGAGFSRASGRCCSRSARARVPAPRAVPLASCSWTICTGPTSLPWTYWRT
jgi:DNA-binding SARP family transcriptional activator